MNGRLRLGNHVGVGPQTRKTVPPAFLLSGLAFGQEPKSGWHRSLLDRDLNSLGNLWLPTNTDTTAYNSHPVVYPIVDSPALSALGPIAIEDRK